MKRRTAFGLPGILALSAGLAFSCHSPDFTPGVTSVTINRSSIVLPVPDSPYNFVEGYTLVVTLRPSLAWDGAIIEWGDNSDNRIVFIKYDTMKPPGEYVYPSRWEGRFGQDGRAEVKIVGYSKGTAFVYARVRAGDSTFYVWCTIEVRKGEAPEESEESEGPEEPGPEEPTEPGPDTPEY